MATEPDLKSHFHGLEADSEEMDRYRDTLATHLSESRAKPTTLAENNIHFLFRPTTLSIAASIIVIAVFSVFYFSQPAFPQQSIEQLQALIDNDNQDTLRQRALKFSNGNNLDTLNATMILARTAEPEQATEFALQGLETDPRPEFRREYLELLLDNSEQTYVDPSYLETAMENESDSVCIALYQLLLRFA